jgi:pimeloyl-ACP methyl ester carboxylesterase
MSLSAIRRRVLRGAVSILAFAIVAEAAPPKAKINWSPCYRETGFPFECGTVQVPLDYGAPNGAAISLALIRLPATDPGHRIGSLFFNPGGPGGSGFDFVLGIGPYVGVQYYTPDIRNRFDLVGFDPRGIARSTPLRCFGNTNQSSVFAPFAFPMTPDEEALWESGERSLVGACDQRARDLIAHMTTADVARDLDLLREAVGDDRLSYIGYSYGTYIGATYANLFPDKFRAIVVDGVLDPVAWSTGDPGQGSVPFSTRLRSDAGAQATLDEFFRLCDAGSCAFAPGSADRFRRLAEKLVVAPFTITTPDGVTYPFRYSDLIGNALSAMYSSYAWPDFAAFLAALESFAPPDVAGARLFEVWTKLGFVTKRGTPRYPNFAEGFPGVACSDSNNPDSYPVWWDTAQAAEMNYGYFGRIWTWASSICATWPGPANSRYAGPFSAKTANPVMVVGNLYDPATRYEGAKRVAGLLDGATLLTLHGWGHCSLGLSHDVDLAVSRYLIDGTLPASGTVYDQDWVPFATTAGVAPSTAGLAARQLITIGSTPDSVRRIVRQKKD